MKQVFAFCALLLLIGAFTPAQANNASISGFIYQDSVTPGEGFGAGANKVGKAVCTSFFGLVGLGNCSIKTAMKNGGIKSTSYFDVMTKNILGYKKVTVQVYGN